MKKITAILLPLLMLGVLGLAACGKQPGGQGNNTGGSCATTDTIHMNSSQFLTTCTTIKSGSVLHFADDQDGTIHILCLGQDGSCSSSGANANGPQTLQGSGFQINAGETKDVTFDKAGTFTVTCTVHPQTMAKLTVNVQ